MPFFDPSQNIEDAQGDTIDIVSSSLKVSGTVETKSKFIRERDAVVGADYFKSGISGSATFLAIDLDNQNGTGPYKHTLTGSIRYIGTGGTVLKEKTGAEWDALFGTILQTSTTGSNVGWFQLGSLHARSSDTNESTFRSEIFPVHIDTRVENNDFSFVAAKFITEESDIQSDGTLEDIKGNQITPEVGDTVLKVENISGGGTAEVHYSFWYYTVE